MKSNNIYALRFKKLIFFSALVVFLLLAAVWAVNHFNIQYTCIFKLITKLKCPGCGSTHAVIAYMNLDFLKGLKFNFAFPLEALYIVFVYIVSAKEYIKNGKYKYKSPSFFIDIVFLIIIIAWTVIRNYFML